MVGDVTFRVQEFECVTMGEASCSRAIYREPLCKSVCVPLARLRAAYENVSRELSILIVEDQGTRGEMGTAFLGAHYHQVRRIRRADEALS